VVWGQSGLMRCAACGGGREERLVRCATHVVVLLAWRSLAVGRGFGGDARTKREQAPALQKGCVKRVKYFDGCGFASRVY